MGIVFKISKYFVSVISVFIFLSNSIIIKPSYCEESKKENIFNNKNYVLDAGDKISIRIFQIDKYNSDVVILPDGNINLPRLGLINIRGLKINEAQDVISNAYKKIIKNPIIYINLLEARPIRFTISGQVLNPGFYVFDNQMSTIVEAIKLAGGISDQADIRKIVLNRYNSSSKRMEMKNYNFWGMLNGELLSVDPIIYDGDSIHVEKITNASPSDLISLSNTNLSSQNISINIIGEINSPGLINLRSNSTLNDAIVAGGGLTRYANKRKISLFRLLNNGTVSKKVYRYDLMESFNSSKNPKLRNKDVIIIKPNFLAQTERTISDMTRPLSPAVNALSIYKIFNE